MNCFPLDYNIVKSVEYHMDSHVVKIILEGVQMLSSANIINGLPGCYKLCHPNHPMTKWVASSSGNYIWMFNYVNFLNQEWKYRFDHTHDHKSIVALKNMPIMSGNYTPTKMPTCMPDECVQAETSLWLPVNSYRNYYQTSKQHLAKWTKRPMPSWYNYTGVNTIETRK